MFNRIRIYFVPLAAQRSLGIAFTIDEFLHARLLMMALRRVYYIIMFL